MLKRSERIGHGDVGEISGDLVLLAENLKLLPGEAVEIHRLLEEREIERF